MTPVVGWSLAVLAIAAGYAGWGWPGVVLGVTVIVFWLLLQFSRTVRLLRQAAGAPVGHVPSAVMLQARLREGMRLAEVIRLAGSLGRKVKDTPETFAWTDDGGACTEVELTPAGRVSAWRLRRPETADPQ